MNLKEIKELLDLITEKDIAEFELERAGVRLRISRARKAAAAAPEPPAPAVAARLAAATPAPPAAQPPAEELHVIKSPIVGTFYESPTPGAPPFVRVGDRIEAGHVLCIIEAMKLMNEIESDASGEVVKRFVENAQPIEYGEALFAIRPALGKKT